MYLQSVLMSLYNAGSSAGNIIGPLLFNKKDAPQYVPGLRAVLILFVALICLTGIQAANLMFLNKTQERKRVANGKPAKIKDLSMTNHYGRDESELEENDQTDSNKGLLDLSDRKNDQFVYLL